MSYIIEDLKILASHYNSYASDKQKVMAFENCKESLLAQYKASGTGNPEAAYQNAIKTFVARYKCSKMELINDLRLIKEADIDELIKML